MKRTNRAAQWTLWGAVTVAAAAAKLTVATQGTAVEPAEQSRAELAFGETTELTVNDDDPEYGNFFVDLDKGRVFSPPEDWQPKDRSQAVQWWQDNGVDLFGESYGLLGIDVIAIPTAASNWDPHRRIFEQLEMGDAGRPVPLTGHGELPATYFFQTRKGNRGVLQICSFNKRVEGQKPASTTIRFKLVK